MHTFNQWMWLWFQRLLITPAQPASFLSEHYTNENADSNLSLLSCPGASAFDICLCENQPSINNERFPHHIEILCLTVQLMLDAQ
uniref:Secreted protein n=1 Tax=Anguilla anguilla TaxID=7936 RepID=A0A0E9RIJ4_ANGAN